MVPIIELCETEKKIIHLPELRWALIVYPEAAIVSGVLTFGLRLNFREFPVNNGTTVIG